MDQEQFAARVEQAEVFAQRSPALYRLSVLAWAALGYLYIAFWGLLALAAAVTLVVMGKARPAFLKLGWILAIVAYQLARAMVIRLDPAEGLEILPGQAPVLFAELERLRQTEKLPRLHRVLVDLSFNAGVSSRPRWGWFGPQQHELVLGLPLFLALDADHARAVLAHELGHIGGGHGRTGALVYRVRRLWQRVGEAFEVREGLWSFVFRRFFRWYGPRFHASSMVLARAQEHEADEMSKRSVGAVITGEALVGVHVWNRCLDEGFWESLPALNRVRPTPPEDLVPRMRAALAAAKPAPLGEWLEESLEEESAPDDTHPVLRARLDTLGVVPSVPPPPAKSAAETLFGTHYDSVVASLTEQWRGCISDEWSSIFADWERRTKRLAELDALAAAGKLGKADTADQDFEHADLVEDVRGRDASVPMLRALLERKPGHVSALFALGQQLLAEGEREGVAPLERAMAADPSCEEAGCRLVSSFLAGRGESEQARVYGERSFRRREQRLLFEAERADVTEKDLFVPHALSPEALAQLLALIDGEGFVKRAYLAQKQLQHRADEEPVGVLVLHVRNTFWRSVYLGVRPWGFHALMKRDPGDEILDRVREKVKSPLKLFLVTNDGPLQELAAKVRKVKGSEIYRRGRTVVPAAAAAAEPAEPVRTEMAEN